MRLHGYFRSSAAYRVRIALALKGIAVESVPVHLLRGEQRGEEFHRLNPQGLVPVLQVEAGTITQSLAIVEWLEETHPLPALLPRDPYLRARVRSFALAIACDVHPLANPRVLNKLRTVFGAEAAQTDAWYRHWVELGLGALEQMVAPAAVEQGVCFGTAPSLADICLVPQMFNARRFACNLAAMPRLVAIDQALTRRLEFQAAAPERQADFQAT
jgi:maleylacetoacetate isomerase